MKDDEFLNHVKQSLDDRANTLDGETRSRLSKARHDAFEQADSIQVSGNTLAWLPASGIAAALLLVSIFLFRNDQMTDLRHTEVDDIEIIASTENIELYEQLDFYLWLLEEDSGAV